MEADGACGFPKSPPGFDADPPKPALAGAPAPPKPALGVVPNPVFACPPYVYPYELCENGFCFTSDGGFDPKSDPADACGAPPAKREPEDGVGPAGLLAKSDPLT